jgi:ankyrin repeat protein
MPDSALQREFLIALAKGDAAGIRELVAAGADVNLPIGNPGGETPLIRAITSEELSLVRLLLQSGADVGLPCKGPRAWTPLMFAHDNPPMLRELAAAGADVNARTTGHSIRSPTGRLKLFPGGETALHLAAAAGNAEAVRVLLQAGAEVEAQAGDGRAPLDYAVQLGSVTEAAEVLVEAGARLTPQRLEAMHAAAHNPDSDLVEFPFPSGTTLSPPSDRPDPVSHEAEKPRQGTAQVEPNGMRAKEIRCPKCHALLYSRKPRICGQCGALLPPELLLSDQKAQALDEERRWARELAGKFGTPDSSQDQLALSSAAQSLAGKSLAENFSPQHLLRRVSCAEEFRHRDRPAFWLYVMGYGLMLCIAATGWTVRFPLLPGLAPRIADMSQLQPEYQVLYGCLLSHLRASLGPPAMRKLRSGQLLDEVSPPIR